MITQAYVYKWTHIPTGMWYIGSRTRRGCHPEDGYICSSEIVEPLVMNNPIDWKREILETGFPVEMYELETELLTTLNAKASPYSYNQHNNDFPHMCGTKPWNAGKKLSTDHIDKLKGPRKKWTVEQKAKLVKRVPWNKGKQLTQEHKDKLAANTRTAETKAKISAAQKGKIISPSHRKKLSESGVIAWNSRHLKKRGT